MLPTPNHAQAVRRAPRAGAMRPDRMRTDARRGDGAPCAVRVAAARRTASVRLVARGDRDNDRGRRSGGDWPGRVAVHRARVRRLAEHLWQTGESRETPIHRTSTSSARSGARCQPRDAGLTGAAAGGGGRPLAVELALAADDARPARSAVGALHVRAGRDARRPDGVVILVVGWAGQLCSD